MNEKTWLLNADIIGRNIKGSQIFMSKQNSDVFTLNETASFIYACLDPAVPLAEIEDRVMREFAIDDREVVHQDIVNLLTYLVENNIIRSEAADSLMAEKHLASRWFQSSGSSATASFISS